MKNDNVTPIRPGHSTGSNGGNGGHGERLARIETRLEHTATREDLKAESNRLLYWFIAVVLAVLGVFGSMTIYLAKELLRLLA